MSPMKKQDREEFEAWAWGYGCAEIIREGDGYQHRQVTDRWAGYQAALTRERARIAGMEEPIARAVHAAMAKSAVGCGSGATCTFAEGCGCSTDIARAVINAILQKGAGNEG